MAAKIPFPLPCRCANVPPSANLGARSWAGISPDAPGELVPAQMLQNACRDCVLGLAALRDFDIEDTCAGFDFAVSQPGSSGKRKESEMNGIERLAGEIIFQEISFPFEPEVGQGIAQSVDEIILRSHLDLAPNRQQFPGSEGRVPSFLKPHGFSANPR